MSTTRAEETDTPEDPAGGPTGVSIELAGLPVGGGSAVAVGDAWCQVLFWRGQLPQDVELDVEAVEILDEGAVLQPDGCGDATPCVGTVIAVSGSQMCSVLVTPDSAQTPSLRVRLDGTLRCPDAQECESVRAVDNSTFLIENPGGGELDDDSGAGEVVPSGNGDGSDNISDSAGDGGATPASSP